jgi:hypothetical protein
MSAPDFAHRTDHRRFFLRKRGRPQMFSGTEVAWAAGGDSPGRLSSANIDSLTTLAGAFTKIRPDLHDDDVVTAVEAVAMQVAVRGDDLLPQASAEQLATMRGMFGGPEVQLAPRGTAFNWPAEADYPGAFAKVVKEMENRDEAARLAHDTQCRPKLDNRDRSRDRSVER